MSPDEAAIEAAGSGEEQWMNDLLNRFDCFDDIEPIVLAAATNGHLELVKSLSSVFCQYEENGELDVFNWERLTNMARVVAENGHLDVVEYLLPQEIDPDLTEKEPGLFPAVRRIWEAAAANGHLDIVKFIAEKYYPRLRYSSGKHDVLLRTISGKQAEVAKFLLEQKEFCWNFPKSCATAVSVGLYAIVDKIYSSYKSYYEDSNLFNELARIGNVDTLKYLYSHGHNDADLVCKAFATAVCWGKMEAAEFLLETGCISPDVFDKAFETATYSFVDREIIVSFLFNKSQASLAVITRVFETAQHADVTKFLFENTDFPDKSIITAFQNSAGCGRPDEVEIMKLLYKLPCITSKMIRKAFLDAVTNWRAEIV